MAGLSFSTLCGFLVVRRQSNSATRQNALSFSTLCGFLVVRSYLRVCGSGGYPWFQYPLRVLGCEKTTLEAGTLISVTFQYPLRVLGCEKCERSAANCP